MKQDATGFMRGIRYSHELPSLDRHFDAFLPVSWERELDDVSRTEYHRNTDTEDRVVGQKVTIFDKWAST